MSKNTYDVIIIGAGSIGVPAAHRLAAEGLEVLVIDKFASQGQGSNKAAIGGIRATHSDPAKIKLCQRTLEIVSTWEDVYGHNLEWTTGGYSFVAYRQKEEKTLKDLLVVQKGYGLNIDWYDKDALLERVPDLNPHGLIGGTISPEDGHCSTILAGHAYYDVAKQYGKFQSRNNRLNLLFHGWLSQYLPKNYQNICSFFCNSIRVSNSSFLWCKYLREFSSQNVRRLVDNNRVNLGKSRHLLVLQNLE